VAASLWCCRRNGDVAPRAGDSNRSFQPQFSKRHPPAPSREIEAAAGITSVGKGSSSRSEQVRGLNVAADCPGIWNVHRHFASMPCRFAIRPANVNCSCADCDTTIPLSIPLDVPWSLPGPLRNRCVDVCRTLSGRCAICCVGDGGDAARTASHLAMWTLAAIAKALPGYFPAVAPAIARTFIGVA
jgi:hypothetical protein